MPPVKPMLAKATKSMPRQSDHVAGFLYEPKWDAVGFVALLEQVAAALGR